MFLVEGYLFREDWAGGYSHNGTALVGGYKRKIGSHRQMRIKWSMIVACTLARID
jgi:hypothetical protein